MGIICPLCGITTSLNAVLIEDEHAFMPDRSGEREMVYEKAVVRAIKEAEYPHKVSYGIFQCQDCGRRFVAKYQEYEDRDWVVAYPIPHKVVAQEIPEPIKSEFEEASLCFAVGAYRACVSMCGTALEALWRDQQVSGLDELKGKGVISVTLYKRANEVRLWGNVAKHELIPDVVERDDAEQLLGYLEILLNEVYVEPKRLEGLAKKREQLEKGE